MAAFPSPERLARLSTRHPWWVIGVWAIVLVASVAAASGLGSVLTTEVENYVDTESRLADDDLEQQLFGILPIRETIVIQSNDATVDDPAFEAVVLAITERIRALPDDVDPASVTNVYEAEDPSQFRSEDGRTTIIPATLVGDYGDAEGHVEPIIEILKEYDGQNGYTVVTGGDGSASLAFSHTAERDLQRGELMFGVPIALVILLLVFGALVAAGLPLFLAIFSIIIALGLTALLGRAFELSTFVVNFVFTMGLAVGIDYTLIIVQRYREEREHGLPRDEAIVHAGGTASRAVLFSGLAVIVSLFGMVMVPNSIFRSLGIGAILVVTVAVIAALTLLPAMLRLLGDRINRLHIGLPQRKGRSKAESAGGFWDRTSRTVMAHPWLSVIGSVVLLLAAASPYATIKLGWSGVSSLPESSEARRAFDILAEEFSAGTIAPARVVITAPDVNTPAITAAADRLETALGAEPLFGEMTRTVNDAGTLLLLEFPVNADPNGEDARGAIQDLRNDHVPGAFDGVAQARVTGMTALGIDDTQIISDWTLPVFAFVLGLSFIILLVVFRSIVVPVKAMIMNLLSVGAAYGLMVLVFQHGFGNELVGWTQVPRIDSWIPLFMFAVLFGLSMDYHVFLLTRIRERFSHTHNNTESVAYGVRTTAGMITGAAAIMVAVFSGFSSGETVAFQQMGFGLAIAIFIDATIVRTVLVPASMELLGDRNWYLPRWLRWLPQIDVEGASVARPTAVAASPAPVPAKGVAGGQ